MRKYFVAAILLALVFGHFGSALSQVWLDSAEMAPYVRGEILVKLKKTALKNDIVQLNATLGSTTIREFPSIGGLHIKLKPEETVLEAIERYSDDPNVEYAEPNYIVHALATPNDSLFGELWGLHNTGQMVNGTVGTSDADIDAPEAWDITTGDGTVVIAVIDSGVAWDHPELAGNIWTNPGEDPWADPNDPTTGNGIDDDNNGYKDDWRGWDFVNNDNDPMDFLNHGTHVAGTIAGVGNNSRGVTGVMWTASIMSLRFLDATGSGNTADAISAINYAVRNGAKVLNNSWGGGGPSQLLKQAIQRSNSAGTVFVAAAGNEGNDNDSTPSYPASFDVANIISVAATDQNDNLPSFSNYGATSVDVGAPGVDTYSTIPAREAVFVDNFDDGDISDWTRGGTPNTWTVTTEFPPTPTSGTYALADSPGGDYVVNANNWAASPSVDLSGRVGCQFVYQLELAVESLFDFLFIEASTNGTRWTNIYGRNVGYTGSTGGAFFQIADDISAYDGQPTLFVRFRIFESNGSGTAGGAHIDDVMITSSSSDYSADTQYEYFEGTSMATPHVVIPR
jgi:subtilisin family serine protease